MIYSNEKQAYKQIMSSSFICEKSNILVLSKNSRLTSLIFDLNLYAICRMVDILHVKMGSICPTVAFYSNRRLNLKDSMRSPCETLKNN